MQTKINFNAGPAQMPPEVLHEAAIAVRKYKKTGSSILELPHRGKEFLEIMEESKALVKKLCGIDDDYDVMWLQGGGRMQFCMIPMNFLSAGKAAGFIDSGYWAGDAAKYAAYYGDAKVLASSKESNYNHLPEWPEIPKQLAYLHIATNNTIYGTQWHKIPKTSVPLIADMSSDIFSANRDYSQYAMFYAAVQKNLGAAGLALAVVRKDMMKRMTNTMPPMLSYKETARENSILNTPNVFGIYISLLMLRWIDGKGIAAIEDENKRKADLLYSTLDSSSLFTPHVKGKAHRSLMNVCFTANTPEVEKSFLAHCEENDITGVKGHRLAGGFRVSLYNAISLEEVEIFVSLMKKFEQQITEPANPVRAKWSR